MDIVLVGGLWLDPSVWDDVVAELAERGHRGIPVALPGQGDGNVTAALDDQVAAVLAAVDSGRQPLVVGHSAACSLAWIAADRRPERVAGVALIGGFPNPDGEPYAAFFDAVGGQMAFPGWADFEGPDSADLDDATKAAMERAMIPVPEAVSTGVVRLSDDRRYGVPTTLICPEFSPADARGWIDDGQVPELARATRLTLVDLDTGHWPMVSAPAELARVLAEVADGLAG